MPKKTRKTKKSQRKSSKKSRKGRKANGQFKKGHKLGLRAKATVLAYKRRNRRRLSTTAPPRESKKSQAFAAGAYLANKAKEYLHELNELQKYQDYIASRSQIFQPGFFA